MGIFGSLFDGFGKYISGQVGDTALKNAENIPRLVSQIQHCTDEELRQPMCRQVSAIMRGLKMSATSGSENSEKALVYYTQFKKLYGNFFAQNHIDY